MQGQQKIYDELILLYLSLVLKEAHRIRRHDYGLQFKLHVKAET